MSRNIAEPVKKGVSTETTAAVPDHSNIATLAYELWVQRGCPIGTDQEDWFRAEEELRKTSLRTRAA